MSSATKNLGSLPHLEHFCSLSLSLCYHLLYQSLYFLTLIKTLENPCQNSYTLGVFQCSFLGLLVIRRNKEIVVLFRFRIVGNKNCIDFLVLRQSVYHSV